MGGIGCGSIRGVGGWFGIGVGVAANGSAVNVKHVSVEVNIRVVRYGVGERIDIRIGR